MGTFTERMDMLISQCPQREVKGSLVVDQIYAHYQHEGLEFNHPDGGEAEYLRKPLFLKASQYLKMIAAKTIGHNGLDVEGGMTDVVEDLNLEVYDRAPLEFGDLKGSGHPSVEKDGSTVYDRPPNVHRLSEVELRAKSRLRYLFDPHRYRR